MKKYIDKTALVAEIERRIDEVNQIDKASYEVGLFDAYKNILSFIDTPEVEETKEEAVSNNLEEAADNYVGHAPEIDEDLSCFTKRNAFIAGAKWQKEQMITKACNYLFSHMGLFVTFFDDDIVEDIERSEFIKKFRIAMDD